MKTFKRIGFWFYRRHMKNAVRKAPLVGYPLMIRLELSGEIDKVKKAYYENGFQGANECIFSILDEMRNPPKPKKTNPKLVKLVRDEIEQKRSERTANWFNRIDAL